MTENKVLDAYIEKFGERPPLLMTMTYDDEAYIEAMNKAIERGVPLDDDEIDAIADNQEFDVELPDEELSAYQIAKRYGK